ncbi:hypothetical protein GGQ91_002525 [Methylobacterium fujisawaense]|uniref:Lytic transglycosylase n=1 Tax=Methylobacterium fujisawaense TaxID=107400 RepID=A0ABR6DAL7_9HYPH|nr:hypothetical protein [Methylobacterium fujisawaense]MBA9063137.1 hypothetical protein [Methylobacterium fujisawaense]
MAFGFSIPAMGSQDQAFGLTPDMLAAISQMAARGAAAPAPAQPAAAASVAQPAPAQQPAPMAMSLSPSPPEAPRQPAAAQASSAQSGVSPSLVDRIVGAESGGNATAKNPNSSATGAGQFISGTWLDMMKRYRPDLAGSLPREQLLSLRNDPALSREMVNHYAEENGAKLRAAGLPDNDGTRYLSHFAGAGGARSVLSADPSTPVSQVLEASQVAANPFLRNMTAGQLTDWAAGKVSGSAPKMTMPGGSSRPAAFGLSGPTQAGGAGTVLPAGGGDMSTPNPMATADPSATAIGAPGMAGADGGQGRGSGKGGQKQSGGASPMQFRTVRPKPFGFMSPMQFAGQRTGQ